MPAGSTYFPIATTTLVSSAASYTFSSIPGTYTDLILVAAIKGSTNSYAQMYVNGDNTGTSYSQTTLTGNGSSASSARNSSAPVNYLAQDNNINSTDFTPYTVNLFNYANTSVNKTWLTRAGSAAFATNATVSLWSNTNAITSITIQLNSGTIATGSTFTLYGILSA
jgi:microcompartment protein CcmK/EutM